MYVTSDSTDLSFDTFFILFKVIPVYLALLCTKSSFFIQNEKLEKNTNFSLLSGEFPKKMWKFIYK